MVGGPGVGASAILCVTHTGFTVRPIARFRPRTKILGFSADPQAVRRLTLSWGATPHVLNVDYQADNVAVALARERARSAGATWWPCCRAGASTPARPPTTSGLIPSSNGARGRLPRPPDTPVMGERVPSPQ
jgi:hypothetical protein